MKNRENCPESSCNTLREKKKRGRKKKENQKEGKKRFLSKWILELEGRKIRDADFVPLEESKKINTDTELASSLP